MDKCEQCRFWEQHEPKASQNGVIKGICHRNPPVATGCFMPKMNMITSHVEPQLIELTVWACTNSVSWCGEFEPKIKPMKIPENLNEPLVRKPSELKKRGENEQA